MEPSDDNSKCSHVEKQGEPLEKTNRNGDVYTTNGWGVDLNSLTVRHRRSNDPDKEEEQTYYNVTAGQKVGPLNITYTTGADSPFDYWWVKFVTISGTTFTIKDNFYCYISSSDDGTVNLRLDGSTNKMHVTFSSSSSCKVSIYEVSGIDEQS